MNTYHSSQGNRVCRRVLGLARQWAQYWKLYGGTDMKAKTFEHGICVGQLIVAAYELDAVDPLLLQGTENEVRFLFGDYLAGR